MPRRCAALRNNFHVRSLPLPSFLPYPPIPSPPFPALPQIRSRRPVALPNIGFRLVLARHEVAVAGGTSVAKQRHDPMWNFADWRAEEEKYPVRPPSAASARSGIAGGEPAGTSCCSIM